MKKKLVIVVSLVTLAIAVFGAGAIYAWYSSTQSETGHQFTTGTLQVSVNNGVNAPIVKTGMKPGDYGTAANWLVQNTGNLNSSLAVTFTPITSSALNNSLMTAFWIAPDNSHTWHAGDYYLDVASNTFVQSSSSTIPTAANNTLISYGGKTFSNTTATPGGTNAGYFVMYYELNGTVGNSVQGSSTGFDLAFTLNQSQTTQNTGL